MKIKELYRKYKRWRERSLYGRIKGELNAQEARRFYEYGSYMKSVETAINNTILEIEDRIDQKCRDHKTSLAVTFLKDQQTNLLEGVVKHFKEAGFICKIIEFSEIPGYIYLILGW